MVQDSLPFQLKVRQQYVIAQKLDFHQVIIHIIRQDPSTIERSQQINNHSEENFCNHTFLLAYAHKQAVFAEYAST